MSGLGEDDAEGGAAADGAGDFDAALVVFDDFLADGEAEAGALGFALLGGALGGEEGLEDLGEELFGDAGAGVDHLEAGFLGLAAERGGLDREGAALAEHGVAGVDQEVEEHLLELYGV